MQKAGMGLGLFFPFQLRLRTLTRALVLASRYPLQKSNVSHEVDCLYWFLQW